MKFKVRKDYRFARAEQYPSVADYIEAVTEKELGDDKKWKDYMQRVKEVREKYPKPDKTKS